MALRRINKEIEDIKSNPSAAFRIDPDDENAFHWKATLFGPEASPYVGGTFLIDITFPTNYPFKEPRVRFDTKIYHINISFKGIICAEILMDRWSPDMTIRRVLEGIASILKEPEEGNELEPEITSVFKTDRQKYEDKAREWTALYGHS